MELHYEWDDLFARLTAHDCSFDRIRLGPSGGMGPDEVFHVVNHGNKRDATLQIPPRAGRPTYETVRYLCDALGLPHEPFGLTF